LELGYSAADEAFREEVRAFLRDRLPADMARRARRDFHPLREDVVGWTKLLAERGWSVPHWPVEYGGACWTGVQRFIFEEEMRAGFAPIGDRIGVELVGPVLYNFADEAQRQRFLPSIRTAGELWAQGFSEPGSGSDLSSLRTRAVKDGDSYVITGQKTWTTEGHHADLMLALVRSDPDVRAQQGISAVIIDLNSTGVTRRPIWTIDEGLTVNEFFFDDVRIPAANLIGREGDGWTYAKFLLTNERTTSAEVPHTKRDISELKRLAGVEHRNGAPLLEDPHFRERLARIEIDTQALEYAVLRALSDHGASSAVASVLKVRGAELRQRVAELACDAIGDLGAVFTPNPESVYAMTEETLRPPVPEHVIGLASKAVFRRATTIYGGANEVQRSLIAKLVLEL
jgi:alkylation response protein AidB-like acyl-CoA dehydrogenase